MVARVTIAVIALLGTTTAATQTSLPPGEYTRSIRIGAASRSYILHVPPGRADKRAMVLAFHGGASNARGTIRLTGLSDKANKEGFVVVYPNGSGRLASILTWNAGRCCGYAQQQGVDDVEFVRAVLDDVAKLTPIDPARVFATGISNGGQMAYRLAAEMPDRIAAVAPVAASLEVTLGSTPRPVPIVHFHGTNDDHLPFEGGRGRRSIAGVSFTSVSATINAWVKNNGCRPTPTVQKVPDKVVDGTHVERRTYSDCRDKADVVLYVIDGGGHTWPGRVVREVLLGTTSLQISATDLMWEFFLSHPKT